MIGILKENIPLLKNNWDKYKECFKEIEVPAKTVLLKEGEISKKMFFIKKGCLRMAFTHKGRDITFQFFFENQFVSSIESFRSKQPSQFSIESLEPSIIYVISRADFEKVINEVPELKEIMLEILHMRIAHYAKLFLSFIRDTPCQRYIELLKNQPHIVQRIPQHYIASYLGITSVSLSRIRNKILKSH
jgi:CRP-like cAMP-binding protein